MLAARAWLYQELSELEGLPQAVLVTPRKLKAKWSLEVSQDLRAFAGVETELVQGITDAIDQDIVRSMRGAR